MSAAFEDLLITDYTLFKGCFQVPALAEGVAHLPLQPPISKCLNQITSNSFYNITAKNWQNIPPGWKVVHPLLLLGMSLWVCGRLHTSFCTLLDFSFTCLSRAPEWTPCASAVFFPFENWKAFGKGKVLTVSHHELHQKTKKGRDLIQFRRFSLDVVWQFFVWVNHVGSVLLNTSVS